jgi:hypothetical protein
MRRRVQPVTAPISCLRASATLLYAIRIIKPGRRFLSTAQKPLVAAVNGMQV